MVSLKTPNIVNVPLLEAIHELKKVPVDGDLVFAARSVGICLGD
jgi:6-phosphofructokinase 1